MTKDEFLAGFKDAEAAETLWNKYKDSDGKLDEQALINNWVKIRD